MTPQDIAKGLSEAQRAWILAMPDGVHVLTPDEWDALPSLFVQFSPDEFDEETGCYLGGGERFWFAYAGANYAGDGGPWHFTAALNDRGLELRSILQEGK